MDEEDRNRSETTHTLPLSWFFLLQQLCSTYSCSVRQYMKTGWSRVMIRGSFSIARRSGLTRCNMDRCESPS